MPADAGDPTGCRPNHHQPNAAAATKTTSPNSPTTSRLDPPRRSVLAAAGDGGSERGSIRGGTTRVGNSGSGITGAGWVGSAGVILPAPPTPPIRRPAPAVGGTRRPGARRVISTSDSASSSGSNGSCSAAVVRDSVCLRDSKRVGRSSSVDPEPAAMSGIGISGIASSAAPTSGTDDSVDPESSPTGSGRAFGPGSTRVPPTTRRSPLALPSSISSSSGQTKVTAADSSRPWPRTAKR